MVGDLFHWLKEQELKRKTRMHGAADLLEMAAHKSGMPDLEKEEFKKRVEHAFESSGYVFLERAYFDKTLTKMEFVDIMDKYNLDTKDIGVILACKYAAIDQSIDKKKERVVILTTPGSTIDQARKFIYKKFKIRVQTTTEMMATKSFQKFKKEVQKNGKQ